MSEVVYKILCKFFLMKSTKILRDEMNLNFMKFLSVYFSDENVSVRQM